MAQFDVLLNKNPRTSKSIPYLMDVQSDFLSALATRLVVPLIDIETFGRPAARLNPIICIDDERFVMSTAEMAGVPVSSLGQAVTSIASRRNEILAAVDFLLTGV